MSVARREHLARPLPLRLDLGIFKVNLDHGAHPALLARRKADPEIEAQGAGDLVGEECPETPAADPSDDLTYEPAVGHGVVAVCGPRLPHRALRRERFDGGLPREVFLDRQRLVKDGEPDLVA